jgi:hypothetical protein
LRNFGVAGCGDARFGAPIVLLIRATISLEKDIHEKFNKLFGHSGAGESEGATEGGEAGM